MTLNPDAGRSAKTIQIGEMRFAETTTPIFPGVNDSNTPLPLSSFTLKPTIVSLDEAHTRLPFAFALPSWLPDGFVLEPEVRITLPPQELSDDEGTERVRIKLAPSSLTSLHLMWRHADGRFIGLDIHPVKTDPQVIEGRIPIPPGGVVAVQVHQQPAALITHQYGFNPVDHTVAISDVAVLRWREHHKQYELRTRTDGVSVDEMLRIANSISE